MPRIRVTAKQLGDRHFQINLSLRVAVITQTLLRPGKGGRLARVKAVYLGFDSYEQAIAAANDIRSQFPKARITVRKSERLTTAFELKVSHDAAEMLAWNWLNASQTTSQRIERHLAAVAAMPSLQPDTPVLRRQYGNRTLMASGSRMIGID